MAPAAANPDQSDTDGNGVGDACEPPEETRPRPPEELSAFIGGLTELLARGSDARLVSGFDDSLQRLSSVVDGVAGNSLLSVDESGRPKARDPNVVSADDLERLGVATGLCPAASAAMLGVGLLGLHRARRGVRRW